MWSGPQEVNEPAGWWSGRRYQQEAGTAAPGVEVKHRAPGNIRAQEGTGIRKATSTENGNMPTCRGGDHSSSPLALLSSLNEEQCQFRLQMVFSNSHLWDQATESQRR